MREKKPFFILGFKIDEGDLLTVYNDIENLWFKGLKGPLLRSSEIDVFYYKIDIKRDEIAGYYNPNERVFIHLKEDDVFEIVWYHEFQKLHFLLRINDNVFYQSISYGCLFNIPLSETSWVPTKVFWSRVIRHIDFGKESRMLFFDVDGHNNLYAQTKGSLEVNKYFPDRFNEKGGCFLVMSHGKKCETIWWKVCDDNYVIMFIIHNNEIRYRRVLGFMNVTSFILKPGLGSLMNISVSLLF